MKMTYRDQLLHPNWQRKRLEILQRDEFRCQLCQDTETTLHVHHKQYAKGRMAWEYPDDELVTLCETCHEPMHEIHSKLRDITAKLPVDGPGCISDAIGVLAGWAHMQQNGMVFVQHRDAGSPLSYLAGVVAQEMERGVDIHVLSALVAALWDCPRSVCTAAIADLVKTVNAQRGEPWRGGGDETP